MRLLILVLLLFPFLSNAQLTEERFKELIQAHGWHPTARGLLLFDGVHTVIIHDCDLNDDYKYVRLAGVTDSEEKFNIEGAGTIRIENNYFEITLDDSFSSITKYFAGMIISDKRIKFSSSNSPFILTEEGMSDVVWFESRF